MRALVQRVSEASVTVVPPEGGRPEVAGRIGPGLLALIGVTHDDDEDAADRLAGKLAGLRVFADEQGAMNRSVAEVGGAILVVSQFTLYGDCRKGRRPSFVAAAPPAHAEVLIERVVDAVAATGLEVATGRFRTHMDVALVNDGPVTLLVEV